MATRADHLIRLNQRFDLAQQQREYAWDNAQLAYLAYIDNNDHLAVNYLCQSTAQLANSIEYILDEHYPSSGKYSILAFLDEHTEVGEAEEFTLLTFIAAFINADDDHRSAHRLLLDAYQASMYNKPFDMEYHKNWVARFTQWQ